MLNIVYCTNCGTSNQSDNANCVKCNNPLPDLIQQQENEDNQDIQYIDSELVSDSLPSALNGIGVFYFVLSVIAGLYLFLNSSVEMPGLYGSVKQTNTYIVAAAVSCIFSGVIVMVICQGISRVIKQNIYIINNGE